MSLSRRHFLQVAAAATAGATAPSLLAQIPPSKSDVYVGKGKAVDIIPKLLDKMGGIGQFVKKDSRVIIKPNMSFSNPPEWATTTSPEAVFAIARLCIEAGAKRVIVCDNTLHDANECKLKTGIEAAVKPLTGVVVFTPKQDNLFETRTNPRATMLTAVDIVREVLRADALICVPTAKSHSAGGVSFGIKGLMGLVKDRGSMHSKMDLHTAIAEQLYYFKPCLTIIDASRALLDNGPAGPGKVKQLDTFVAGIDPVATDSYGVSLAPWYGKMFEGKNVAHLKYAAQFGFGNVESSMIREIAI